MDNTNEDSTAAFSPPARLGLAIAQADLGYVRAAIDSGVTERSLEFLQHAVLIAFEAHAFCRNQLSLPLPDLAWETTLAEASRLSGKFFDDKKRDIEQLANQLSLLAESSRIAYRDGWRRRLARWLGIYNPDLAVLSVRNTPVATDLTLAFHAGIQHPGPDNLAVARKVAYSLAAGVGEMVAILDAANTPHHPPAVELDEAWVWGDGVAWNCYAQAFAAEVPTRYVPLLIVLQNATATATLVTSTDCCDGCRFAAFKHRLVVAYHVAQSLKKFRNSSNLPAAVGARVEATLSEPAVNNMLNLRALRNGLVHLGLSDAPPEVFASENPLRTVIKHYASGMEYEEVDAAVRSALSFLNAYLTTWLLEPPTGGVGFAGLLRPPAD